MNQVLHFVLGGDMTEQQWSALANAILPFYKARYKFGLDIVFYHYTDDVASLIAQKYPTGPLTLVGHSFGGCKAVQAAAALNVLGRTVDHLVLFDPVEITAWDKPNTVGFAVPSNVPDAICYFRGATEAPYSGQIVSGPNFQNVQYKGDHGACVWNAQYIATIGVALTGGNMIPPKPAPEPAPVPVEKKVVSLTLTYSDGSQQVINV